MVIEMLRGITPARVLAAPYMIQPMPNSKPRRASPADSLPDCDAAGQLDSSHIVQEPRLSPASPDPGGHVATPFDAGQRSTRLRVPLIWGVVFGFLNAAAPLGFWWIRPATVYALGLVLIAAVYIGFAVADGRRNVIAVEISVATVFVLARAVAVTGSLWVAVAGLIGHGAKDLWQHRTGFVNNTRWWPPFCATVDWVAAAIVAIAIAAGVDFG
jgi:hypothetical protein